MVGEPESPAGLTEWFRVGERGVLTRWDGATNPSLGLTKWEGGLEPLTAMGSLLLEIVN